MKTTIWYFTGIEESVMGGKKPKSSLRSRADKIKDARCKNLIAVIENPDELRNVATVIRNINALGVEKAQQSNEITPWVVYFVETVLKAQIRAGEFVDFILRKSVLRSLLTIQ